MEKVGITKLDVIDTKKEICVGMPVRIKDIRSEKGNVICETEIDGIYPFVITMKNGMSCTIYEMVKYLENKSIPLCGAFKYREPDLSHLRKRRKRNVSVKS